MIERVFDAKLADCCDGLLTKLIRDERKYNNSIDKDFRVNNYFKNVIKNKDNILLCYKENNDVVGYIYLKPTSNDTQKGYLIDGLYVDEQYRRNGIAKKLVEESIRIVKEKCSYIDINVMHDNKIALDLYKSLGFKEFKINMKKDF